MRFIIIFLLIIFIAIISNYNYSEYPDKLKNYVIYGKLDSKDKKTYHYQFKDRDYYKIDKYGNVLNTGKYHYLFDNNHAKITINKKQYKIKLYQTQKKDVFKGEIEKRKILLIKIKKMDYIKNLDGKIIKFTNLFSDKKNNKLNYQESIVYYGKEEYTEFNPFMNKNKKYNYFVNDYGKAYIINEKEIIKLLYKNYQQGVFILKSGRKIIEGDFRIINL